jgi:hypothetical protein
VTSNKLPRWDCRNSTDRKLLEDWTNAQLDLMDEPTDAELELNSEMENDESYRATMERHFSSILKRGKTIVAAKNKDVKALDQLMTDPELKDLALRLLTRKPSRGRKKGELRPTDISQPLRWMLEDASSDVDRIKAIWKLKFGKQSRKEDPTATAIAARRNGIDDEDRLFNWRKNH